MPHKRIRTSGTVYINQNQGLNSRSESSRKTKKYIPTSGIDELVERANQIIFETHSVWPPWDFSKNKITICPNRVTITKKSLLSSFEYPMPIENLTGARVFRDFWFATLYIETFGIEKPSPLKFLKIGDARLARRYILALIECRKADIDLPLLNLDDLKEKLKDIGMVRQGSEEIEGYHDI